MTWRGQAGQDAWVHSLHPEPGYFVDVGAHDGVTHSNTKALEQRGWKGLCIEPNHEAFATLMRNRQCKAFPVLASASCGTLPFDGVQVTEGGPATIAAPLTMLIEAAHAPLEIDYLSIDVEGHELEVLDGMDFDRWQVGLITIEHNLYCDGSERQELIYERLIRHGFERVVEDVVAPGYGPYEDWYRRA